MSLCHAWPRPLVGNAADIGFNRYTILNLRILANNLLPMRERPVVRDASASAIPIL